jgi:hypothetical protein
VRGAVESDAAVRLASHGCSSIGSRVEGVGVHGTSA